MRDDGFGGFLHVRRLCDMLGFIVRVGRLLAVYRYDCVEFGDSIAVRYHHPCALSCFVFKESGSRVADWMKMHIWWRKSCQTLF